MLGFVAKMEGFIKFPSWTWIIIKSLFSCFIYTFLAEPQPRDKSTTHFSLFCFLSTWRVKAKLSVYMIEQGEYEHVLRYNM